ncbi:hypothetical protein HID58_033139 [Brassica napus]|uniref:Uncharacterized protein n=1 Tax=Brassica napus TaxID=3708 RepID=A0ABQ8BZL9_BRANA|nr:hypothetical protein HID58_033139 [Brassica napus]
MIFWILPGKDQLICVALDGPYSVKKTFLISKEAMHPQSAAQGKKLNVIDATPGHLRAIKG